jgi:micrococcal nuclease
MDVDRYSRIVGIVFVGKTDVDEELVKNGLVWVYVHYCKSWFCSRWLKMEVQARADKIGLWSHPNPMPPWEYRRIERTRRHYRRW